MHRFFLSLSTTLVFWLMVFDDNKRIEARRNVQKYDQDGPTFVAFGLRTIKHPLDHRRSYLDRRAQVGLRGAIADILADSNEYPAEVINSTENYQESFFASPDKRMAESQALTGKLNYLISPISNQILLNEEHEMANSVGDSLSEKYNAGNWKNPENKAGQSSKVAALECRTIRTNVELTKDDLDKGSGLLVRNCKGIVALNRCEGSCSSSVLPSIKSSNGFRKECRCCNESAFRRIQVRLRECYSTSDNRRIVGTGNEDEPNSYMDIEVEEPIDCKCRSCEAYL